MGSRQDFSLDDGWDYFVSYCGACYKTVGMC